MRSAKCPANVWDAYSVSGTTWSTGSTAVKVEQIPVLEGVLTQGRGHVTTKMHVEGKYSDLQEHSMGQSTCGGREGASSRGQGGLPEDGSSPDRRKC